MGGGDEGCLKLGRRQIYAPFQHAVKVASVTLCVRRRCRLIIVNGVFCKEGAEHGTYPCVVCFYPGVTRRFLESFCKTLGFFFKLLIYVFIPQSLKGSYARAHGHRIPGERSSLIYWANRGYAVHYLSPPAIGAYRQAAANYLS